MKKKDAISKIYSEPKNLTAQTYKRLIENNDYQELLNYTHYFVCKFLQDLDVENFEDNISESYLILHEFFQKKKFPKLFSDHLDKASKFAVEKLAFKEVKEKACNQDLNFDKRVQLQTVEHEIDSKIDVENSSALKIDLDNALKESVRLNQISHTRPAAKKHAEIFAELHGICGKEQKSVKALAKKHNVSIQLISKINLLHLRILKHPHYKLFEHSERYIKNVNGYQDKIKRIMPHLYEK